MSTKPAAQRTPEPVLYPGQVVPQSHPDHLACIATLLGMQPQPADRCRVLGFGPSALANLAPMADRHPESSFVAVDAAADRMEAAQRTANDAGLRNIDFLARGLEEIDHNFGTFDYVICHDVAARGAPAQLDTLLEICRARLNPQGVAYISYATMPGQALSGMVRQLLCRSAPATLPIERRVALARKSLEFTARAAGRDRSAYGAMLTSEVARALRLTDVALVHEYLTADNRPFYFHEFIRRAGDHDLQYLGDAEISTMSSAGLGLAAEQNLARIAGDAIAREQYVDLLRNRPFRRTLLCRKDATLGRQWLLASFRQLRLAGNLRPEGEPGDLRSNELTRFATRGASVISSVVPSVKVALAELGRAWPCAIAFDELAKTVAQRLADDQSPAPEFGQNQQDELAQGLLECVANGIIVPLRDADRFVASVSKHPCASRWTRMQAESALPVANRRHEPVVLDEMSHNLLRYLDGERDRAALLVILTEAAETGKLSIFKGGIPTSEHGSALAILEQVLEQCLDKLARSALLVS